MKVRGALAAAAVALLTVSAAACGDDDDSGGDATTTAAATGGSGGGDASDTTEEDYLAAIEAQFTASGDDSLQMTDEQASCVAPKWLDVITVERLKDKGVTPAQVESDTGNAKLASLGLSDGDAEKMFAAFGDCDVAVKDQLAKSVATSVGQDAEVEECIKDAMPDELIERIFVVTVTKGDAGLDADPDLSSDLLGALETCIPTTTATS